MAQGDEITYNLFSHFLTISFGVDRGHSPHQDIKKCIGEKIPTITGHFGSGCSLQADF
jgi:hypothetical protein